VATPRDREAFAYTHPKGCWIVILKRERYYYAAYVMDGRDRHTIPLMLSLEDVERTLEKLRKMPGGRVRDVGLFLRCVKGAALMSMKYGK